ncbi:hypothetical protein AHF37_08821 [Paragonimus kellicotti]|nr:hypothetical protein AHF37_08821 [Paragonimus kellicotti]
MLTNLFHNCWLKQSKWNGPGVLRPVWSPMCSTGSCPRFVPVLPAYVSGTVDC